MSNKTKQDAKINQKEVDTVETVETQERELHQIESLRGEVVILEGEGETLSGIFTGKQGRTIGKEGDHQIETIEILSDKTGTLKLLPAKTVLKNLIEAAKEKHKKDDYPDYFFCQITYLGKKKGQNYTYDNFSLATGYATDKDVEKLAEFERLNS